MTSRRPRFTFRSSGPRRARTLTLTALAAALLLAAVFRADAFKVGIHETITEQALQSRGFDADSADEVGDSNYYTDIFEPTNAAAHADNNQLAAASQRLRDKITTIRQSLQACERRDALDALGEALHTVQDVYSHSNAVDNGIAIPDLLNMQNGTAACSPPQMAPGGLVTGYFSLGGFLTGNQCRGKPANMCCHFDLNKDDDSEDTPNRARHPQARAEAIAATGRYLDLVEQDIRDRVGGATAEQLIKMLKRKQRTVMFVIDDTGSMSNDIAGVKSSVNAILNQLIAGDEAPTLGLVTFKDNVSNRGLTCDIEALRAQINALFASGGGDCPEAMNSALLSAIFTFPRGRSDIQLHGGRILLATDASARDPGLGPQVQSQAAIRGISIDAILTGDCVAEDGFAFDPEAPATEPSGNEDGGESGLVGPPANNHTGDPLTSPSARTYLRALTEQTGGVLFNVLRVEVDDVVPTLIELSEPDSALLLTRRIDLVAGSPVTVEIPVDDTLAERVTFMVTASTSGGLPVVTLRRPDGTVVQPTDPGVVRRTLSSVISYVVTAPAVGTWELTLGGNSRVVARAFGPSPLHVNGLRLLEPVGVPNRPEIALVPLSGQPVALDELVAEVRLATGPIDATLFLRRSDGSPIDQRPMVATDGVRRFQTPLTVPGEPFVLEVEGLTLDGNPYIRHIATPLIPRLIGLAVEPPVVVAAPGTTASVELTIENVSAVTSTYSVSVSRTLPWAVSVPGPVTVAGGEEATVAIGVLVPAAALEGDRNDLTVLVQDVAVPTNRNSASAAVIVGSTNQPPDCSAAAPSDGSLWPPNHRFEAISILGVADPDADPVAIAVTGITQDEAVDAPGSGSTAPDGRGLGTDLAEVRAERAGGGDGRVYAIAFTADDGRGGSCSGEVRVGVPHSVHGTAVDSGQHFDSTVVP